MEQPEEETLAFQITELEDRLHIMEGLVTALADPLATLRVISDAEDPDMACAALAAAYSFSEWQARAALDLQFRRVTRRDLARIRRSRDEMVRDLDQLRSQLPETEE